MPGASEWVWFIKKGGGMKSCSIVSLKIVTKNDYISPFYRVPLAYSMIDIDEDKKQNLEILSVIYGFS